MKYIVSTAVTPFLIASPLMAHSAAPLHLHSTDLSALALAGAVAMVAVYLAARISK